MEHSISKTTFFRSLGGSAYWALTVFILPGFLFSFVNVFQSDRLYGKVVPLSFIMNLLLIKVEFATENDNNYIECMTQEEAINKVRTLKLAKYLNPFLLYAF